MKAQTVNTKNKTVALLLAIFLGFWTWIYTYQKDGWKFWLSLALTLVGMIVMSITTVNIITSRNELETNNDVVAGWFAAWIIAYIITIGLWIWGILDRALKRAAWYENYPNL
jgi:hypothetical protein